MRIFNTTLTLINKMTNNVVYDEVIEITNPWMESYWKHIPISYENLPVYVKQMILIALIYPSLFDLYSAIRNITVHIELVSSGYIWFVLYVFDWFWNEKSERISASEFCRFFITLVSVLLWKIISIFVIICLFGNFK